MVPVTVSWEELGLPGLPDTRPQVTSGRDWFEGLSDTEQRQYMGGAMWRAWKDGAVKWEELSHEHDDPTYGLMRVMPSLKQILGQKAQDYYRR